MSMRHAAAMSLALLVFLAGCTEVVVRSPSKFILPPAGPPPGPPKIPRLLFVTPNIGPEAASTQFFIEAANLVPDAPAVVQFGSISFNGRTNATGSRIEDPMGPGGQFVAPPGTGVVDVEVFVSGQNPPTLQLANAFYYLPAGSPALPTTDSMTPNTSDQFGGAQMAFTGTNVPLAAGYQIVVSFLFSSATIPVVAQQTTSNAWSCQMPAVPAAENFSTGTLNVNVTVTFSGGGLPVPIITTPPNNPNDGNPLRYTASANPPPPDPEEFVFASGLFNDNATLKRDSYVRTISLYEESANALTNKPISALVDRFMYTGASRLAPNGTHYYPAPLMNSGASLRDANSIFAHFALPEFNRRFTPAGTAADPNPSPITRPVTGRLYHFTNAETTGAPTGGQDGFFAAYSNGEIERFAPGPTASIWEEIHIHEQFATLPFFATVYDTPNPRVYIGRMDGLPFIANGENMVELNVSSVQGRIHGLSLCFAGPFLYFSTESGNVYRAPVDSPTSGVNPIAQVCAWPATGNHAIVSDQLSLSGDGTTICFIAGTGTTRWDSFGQAPTAPDTHDVFAIRNANTGSTTITAVTAFGTTTAGARQLVFWNLGDGPTSTYGSQNLDNGSNSRRVYMAGVNNFGGANRPGSDVVVNYSGNLCAFVARENRATVDPPNSDAVVNYLYIARVDQTNQMLRINSATNNNFGLGNFFNRDMAFVPGFWFPRKTPNAGMDRRLVFTCSGIAGGTQGAEQHLFTVDVNISGAGLSLALLADRSDSTTSAPYNVGAAQSVFNYFGAFPSLNGNVLFLIEQRTAQLQFLDLRDGVTSLVENVRIAHSQADVILPNDNTSGAPLENTYLPNGFASDPAGSTGLEHWGNSLRTVHGPQLGPFLSEYLYFVAEENPGEQDVYVLQMSGLANPMPSEAINVTNIPGPGAIKLVAPSRDGGVLAAVKGLTGHPQGYKYSGVVDGALYIVNDIAGALGDNATALTRSAERIITPGLRISRGVDWYHDTNRYTLYFGEGSSAATVPTRPTSMLRFTRLDLDRINNNAIQPYERIYPGGNTLSEGAVYIYTAGKRR